MSDPELEALRQQRLAQLQAQYKVNATKLDAIYILEFMTCKLGIIYFNNCFNLVGWTLVQTMTKIYKSYDSTIPALKRLCIALEKRNIYNILKINL